MNVNHPAGSADQTGQEPRGRIEPRERADKGETEGKARGVSQRVGRVRIKLVGVGCEVRCNWMGGRVGEWVQWV